MTYSIGDFRLAFGDRLRQQRKNLGLTQQQMASRAGIRKQAQLKYETGQSSPSADYLAFIQHQGVDVGFVLTGVPTPAFAGDEAELLRRYRSASPELRAAALSVLGVRTVGAAQPSAGVSISGGRLSQVIEGGLEQRDVTFNMGNGKKGEEK